MPTTIQAMPPRQTMPTTPVTIRFPVELHEWLTKYARDHGRPFTAQVMYWLQNDREMAERGEHPRP